MHFQDNNVRMRHYGAMKLVFGGLLLLNAFVWPKWSGIDGWVAFFAVMLVAFGVITLILSMRGHGLQEMQPIAKKKKKEKK